MLKRMFQKFNDYMTEKSDRFQDMMFFAILFNVVVVAAIIAIQFPVTTLSAVVAIPLIFLVWHFIKAQLD